MIERIVSHEKMLMFSVTKRTLIYCVVIIPLMSNMDVITILMIDM